MESQELIQKLELFKDKAFCHYSHYKAGQIWREIGNKIPKPYYYSILTEWEHIQLGHGFKQACSALDDEIKKCIEYLKSS